jgi:hypothetical protein
MGVQMSADYSKICQNYCNGKCIYTNGKYGVFQNCIFEKLCEEFKEKLMKKCNLGKAIELMREEEKEKSLESISKFK